MAGNERGSLRSPRGRLVASLRERVCGKLFPIKDLWTRVWQTLQVFIYTQLYAPYNFICS